MKFAEKDFNWYWGVIKIPLAILVGWSVAALIIANVSYSLYKSIFSGIAGLIFGIAVYGFIGWTTVKDHSGTIKQGSWAGALTGLIGGFAGAIIGFLLISMVPGVVEDAVAQGVQRGAPADAVRQSVQIGMYIAFISGPLFGAVIGAIISAVGALIAKKT
jgi:hypothetical protein